MTAVLVRVPNSTGGTKVFSVVYDDSFIVWHLKVVIFSLTATPPAKQSLFISGSDKELDVSVIVSFLNVICYTHCLSIECGFS